MSSIFETTSEAIKEWRAGITSRLSKDGGFSTALEEDASKQREIVDEWLKPNTCFCGSRSTKGLLRHTSRAVAPIVRGSGVSKPRRTVSTNVKNAIEDSTVCIHGVDAVSVSASNALMRVISQTRIGSTGSMEGVQFPNVAVKVPAGATKAAYSDFKHEALIAMFATNSLRPRIPNFPFVYAYLETESVKTSKAVAKRAASPRRDMLKSTPVNEVKSCPAVLVEDIGEQSGETISVSAAINGKEHFLAERDFAEILIQLSYALKMASEEFSFTHYDLQSGNVMLRPIKGVSDEGTPVRAYIPYDDGRVYVSSKWIACLVEFGFSHAMIVNSEKRRVSFGFSAQGKSELVELGIFRDRENPMTDIYRFILTSAVVALKASATPVINVLRACFKYFNASESLEDAIAAQSENYFYLPLTAKTRVYNFEDFITFVKREARSEKWVPEVRYLTITTTVNGATPKRGAATGSKFLSVQQQKFGPWPSISTTVDPTTHSVVPSTFTGFFDSYNNMISSIDSEFSENAARTFSSVYIRGFSENRSKFNESIKNAISTASHIASLADMASKEGDKIAVALSVLELFDLRQCADYTIKVYWSENEAPQDVTEVLTLIDKILEGVVERYKAIPLKPDERVEKECHDELISRCSAVI